MLTQLAAEAIHVRDNPYTEGFAADPYPRHAVLRDAGPVLFLEALGVYGVARHAETLAVLNDHAAFISGAGAGLHNLGREKAWRPPSVLLEADPPLHDETRGVFNRVLSPPVMRRLRAAFEAEANALVDELCERGSFDGITDVAVRYPLKVVGDAVGVPVEGRGCLLPYGNMLFNSFGPDNAVFRASVQQGQQVAAEIFKQCSRDMLAPDSIGAMFYAAADEGRLQPQLAPQLVRSFLSAGFDTTLSGLGHALYAFATHPEQWRLYCDNAALRARAFDEVIRWETPAQFFFRTTALEVELAGVRIPADEKVMMLLGSANRDPRRWDRPGAFDITRSSIGHVAFGSGLHNCVGQMLARMEADLIFAAFARRVEAFELDGAPVRRPNNTLRVFQKLPLRLRVM